MKSLRPSQEGDGGRFEVKTKIKNMTGSGAVHKLRKVVVGGKWWQCCARAKGKDEFSVIIVDK